ncbi:MAG: radical protein, partial [Nitrospirae bacterium]|nr:radical protein [Nitrospirota bacterium]
MLLINPPVVKPSEPPAGIAKLAGALAANNVPCRVLDANIEGLLFLMGHPGTASDTWGRRAIRNSEDNLAALRGPATYHSLDRYKRAVRDVDRLLALASAKQGDIIGLSDH